MKAEGYESFVVRFWCNQAGPEQPDRWPGEIEHIQSGTRWNFNTLSELLTFLQPIVTPEASSQGQSEKIAA